MVSDLQKVINDIRTDIVALSERPSGGNEPLVVYESNAIPNFPKGTDIVVPIFRFSNGAYRMVTTIRDNRYTSETVVNTLTHEILTVWVDRFHLETYWTNPETIRVHRSQAVKYDNIFAGESFETNAFDFQLEFLAETTSTLATGRNTIVRFRLRRNGVAGDAYYITCKLYSLGSSSDRADTDIPFGIIQSCQRDDPISEINPWVTEHILNPLQSPMVPPFMHNGKSIILTVELKDLQKTIDQIPKFLNHNVYINVRPGNEPIALEINRFTGPGALRIYCVDENNVRVTQNTGTHVISRFFSVGVVTYAFVVHGFTIAASPPSTYTYFELLFCAARTYIEHVTCVYTGDDKDEIPTIIRRGFYINECSSGLIVLHQTNVQNVREAYRAQRSNVRIATSQSMFTSRNNAYMFIPTEGTIHLSGDAQYKDGAVRMGWFGWHGIVQPPRGNSIPATIVLDRTQPSLYAAIQAAHLHRPFVAGEVLTFRIYWLSGQQPNPFWPDLPPLTHTTNTLDVLCALYVNWNSNMSTNPNNWLQGILHWMDFRQICSVYGQVSSSGTITWANAFPLLPSPMLLGPDTINHRIAVVHDHTDAGRLDLPIGSFVLANTTTDRVTNASVGVHRDANNRYTLHSTNNTPLHGTWRVSGMLTGGNIVLMRRTR